MRLPSKAPSLNFALLGVVLLAVSAAGSAAEPLPAATGARESPARANAAGVAAPVQSATPPSLAEIVTALEALDTTDGDIGKRLADAARLDAQRTEIDDEENALASVRRPGADASLGLVELFALPGLRVI